MILSCSRTAATFLLCLLLTGVFAAFAATSVTRNDGVVVAFEDWSSPETVTIPAETGNVTGVRRRCAFTERRSEMPLRGELEMLVEPGNGVVWLGWPADKYVMFRGSIFGMRAHVQRLLIMRSQPSAISEGTEAVVNQFFERVVEQPHIRRWPRSLGYEELTLRDIYGGVMDLNRPTGRSMITNTFAILDLIPTLNSLRVRMLTDSGHFLTLDLDENLEVVGAETDDKPVHVLFDGRLPYRHSHGFHGLGEVKVFTDAGSIGALVASRGYSTPGDDPGNEATRAMALVMPDTGELWIGPADCRLLRTSRGILGFMIVNEEELAVFVDREVRVPINSGSATLFQRLLEQFDAEFNANGRIWRPAMQLDIRTLVPEAAHLRGFSLKYPGPFTEGGEVVLLLNTSDGNTEVKVRLGLDLSTVSGNAVVARY